ncbi:hypothetical protein [Pedobacter cryotolerans]|uniref:DUF3299 domain-containing protein n=1 Tax=Pedobacter cryotolerans TaxID=2571270 RepID=A0A4U1CBX8_9SPHI|nr:hypothetical protein [Pedobacter cryotolerans]RZJ81122.1 MAG: hypothetical protein EOO47_05315 [Flavobacterium sp.]TKC01290.1 hypothetical protein FA045_08610 [Pedobacter cryotolerans]
MKKISLIILLLAGFGFGAKAQHDPSDQIFSSNWDVIGSVDFKTVKDTEMYAIFGNDIKKHANKPFELEGYIVPIKDGMKQTKFMLSTLPINQCFYCGKNGVPIMVQVELKEPVKFTYQTVRVKGILKLSTANAMDTSPISLVAGTAL